MLRIINAALNNQLFFKIANHKMKVVAIDAAQHQCQYSLLALHQIWKLPLHPSECRTQARKFASVLWSASAPKYKFSYSIF